MPAIEVMGPRPPFVAMHFHEVAASFPRQRHCPLFHLASDTLAPRLIVDGKITDPGKIPFYGQLWDKMKGQNGEDAVRSARAA